VILERPRTVLVLAAFALLATAGAIDLIEPTEARYAQIAQEMRRTGDYLTPHLNGLAYYHKPPFAYWTVAASFAAFGENARAARIPVALATMASLAFLLLAVRRRFGALVDSETVPLWVYATAILPFAVGRTLATDPFLTAAVLGYWALAPSPLAIALLGVGFFIKGPVVFVSTVLPVLAAAWWGRDRSTLRLLGPASGWVLCALVALPWYVIEALKTPGLVGYLLGYQLWDRYTTTVHGRPGPPWYFVAVALAGALPWTPALIAGIARVFARRAREDARLLLCWLLVPIAFLTPSGSKLPAYVLPCFGAVSILAGAGLERGRRGPLVACAVTLMVGHRRFAARALRDGGRGRRARCERPAPARGRRGARPPRPGRDRDAARAGARGAARADRVGHAGVRGAAVRGGDREPAPARRRADREPACRRARGRDAPLHRRGAVLSGRAGAAPRRRARADVHPRGATRAVLIDRDRLRAP
jgi:4-amino-4-deoxy-L-arabinose transferase-like glycosyltransferase